jgi:hypothetical protein
MSGSLPDDSGQIQPWFSVPQFGVDGAAAPAYRSRRKRKALYYMKLLLKCIVLLAALGVLVVLGRDNPQTDTLNFLSQSVKQPAAFLFYGLFGLIMSGGKKSGASAKPAKSK